MQDTYIQPIPGELPNEYFKSSAQFLDENKSNYLNKILRGEISAVEAYEQVIPYLKNERDRFLLSEIRNEHDRNVEKLRMLVEHSRFAPTEDSGAWGTLVTTFVGAANLVGTTASLKALEEGEEHGLKQYNECLKFPLTEEERSIFVSDFIPGIQRHIASLRHMIANQDDD
jgi:demethoxyubiquinone hydroxylase (CLK1/Coq7/Cat5 family)